MTSERKNVFFTGTGLQFCMMKLITCLFNSKLILIHPIRCLLFHVNNST